MQEIKKEIERVLLVGLDKNLRDFDIDASMEELEDLASASGAKVITSLVQNKEKEDPATYIGKGKAEEIYIYCEELSIDTVIFNDELTGSQLRNLEKIINRNIVDRTNLILDIFAQRAVTNEGKLQVKLAQLKYRLPRLSGKGIYMSRTGGGIGTRGPGEQKLESDRRHILREINNIEDRLKVVKKNRDISRKKRNKTNIPIVSLVGYTNAGKSTLMNTLSKRVDRENFKEVFVKDMLFATLGTSLRRSKFLNDREFILIDTVGFVSKLPTKLVEAFMSTLEEINYADVIVQVVDVSNENVELQIDTTNKILEELKIGDKPMVYAFNKIDMLDEGESLNRFKNYSPYEFISAKNSLNIDKLLDLVYENLNESNHSVKLFFSFKDQDKLSYLTSKYKDKEISYNEEGSIVNLIIDDKDYERFKDYIYE